MRHFLLLYLFLPSFVDAQSSPGLTTQEVPGMTEVRSEAPWAEKDFWIAPNPATEYLNIYASSPADNVCVQVYSILGKRLYTFEPQVRNGDALLRQDVTGWYPGTYLVRLERNGHILKTMRFIRR